MLCERDGRARCAVVPIDDARRARCSTSSSACSAPRTKLVAVAHVSNALGTVNPVARDRRAGARRAACRCWSTARRRRRTCRSTCRRSAATSTPSPATSCTARPASACSTARRELLEAMPPYQGGGDMIRSVTLREDRPTTSCRYKFEAGTPTSPARSASARRSTTLDGARPRARSRRTSTTCSRYATARLARDARAAPHRHRAATRPACSRSCSTASTRTTSARSSTARASRSAPAITARSR